ncbi:carbon starvation CstA family protein [Lentibacillus juripiscarius]|uniref:Carbon starvation protein A n=1 Tax=Lentibacillus juripiscarius TaxID=257446 RepID=A0ABW5V8X6_9BACI
MITFFISIVVLIFGYFIYGKFVEKTFGIDDSRKTPSIANQDGVDFVPMKKQNNAMIQLLNIAGTGPIFGPIMGALFGPVAFLWIVLGSIFAGGVHDYLTGMISIRNKGAHIPELAGKFLGNFSKHLVNAFALLLLLLVGTVFATTSGSLLHVLLDGQVTLWIIIGIIFLYFLLSTILPIDKIIGRIYPILGATLLIGTLGVGITMFTSGYGSEIPELTLENMHPGKLAIFPMLFLTITCGALSGFHATQTPIISRTVQKESQGRYIFYGMMIAEAVIAMIWAAASMSLFHGEQLNELINAGTPSAVVNEAATTLLGAVGGTIAVLGVIVLPITSGDTAFRAARSVIADYIKFNQKKVTNRLIIAVPLFVISLILTQIDFDILWRYFSWANQTTASLALWIATMYLLVKGKRYWISLIPALFITDMVFVYILNAQIGFNLSLDVSHIGGIILTIVFAIWFFRKAKQNKSNEIEMDLEAA